MFQFPLVPAFGNLGESNRFWLFISFWILMLISVSLLSAFFIAFFADSAFISASSSSDDILLFKWVHFISSVLMFILPPVLFLAMTIRNPFEYLKINRTANGQLIALTILVLLSSLPIVNWMVEINMSMKLPGFLQSVENIMRDLEDQSLEITEAFLQMSTPMDLMLNLLFMALAPAIGEELLFRGYMQQTFKSLFKNHHKAIWLTAFLFSAFHFQFYGFLPRMMLGAVFGYLFHWSGSLWIPILAHFINNASAVVVHYIGTSNGLEEQLENFGTRGETTWYLLPSIFVTSVFLWYFQRISRGTR